MVNANLYVHYVSPHKLPIDCIMLNAVLPKGSLSRCKSTKDKFLRLSGTAIISPVRAIGEDEPFPYDIVSQTQPDPNGDNTVNLAQVIKQDSLQAGTNQSIMSRLTSFFRVS